MVGFLPFNSIPFVGNDIWFTFSTTFENKKTLLDTYPPDLNHFRFPV